MFIIHTEIGWWGKKLGGEEVGVGFKQYRIGWY